MTLENHGLDGKPVAMDLIFANITVTILVADVCWLVEEYIRWRSSVIF